MNFGWGDGTFGMLEAEQLNDSILAHIGSVIAPIFVPLGWGDWKMAVAAVTGLIAKENVVGTFGDVYKRQRAITIGLRWIRRIIISVRSCM